MRIFLDTLYVVALVNQHDQYHQQAKEASEKFEDYLFLITNAVLFEIGNTLSRKHRQTR